MASPFDKFLIAPMNSGLQKDAEPWMIPDDAFERLENAYVFRGKVRKRFGSTFTGYGYGSSTEEQLFSRLRIAIPGGAAVGTTDGSGDANGTVPGAIFKVGQMFSIGTEIYTVSVTGTPGTMLRQSGAATTYTYNTTTGAFVFAGATINTQIYFYPAEPVMGLTQFESNTLNDRPTIAFDTQYAYEYSGGSWGFTGPTLPKRWDGDNSNFFWSVNWRGANSDDNLLFTSNYHATVPTAAATDDPIRYYDGSTWTDFTEKTIVGGNQIFTAKIIIPFKDRLVLLSTIEQNNAATVNDEYTNRCRYSHNGSPLSATAWLEQNQVGATGGGWVDAPTKEQIISAEFIKDRLIVYFEQSTWELVYTSNQILPFVWQQIDSELGSQSKHSTVSFDKAAITIGSRGIHACNGANTSRIDQKIPDEVFKIRTADDGVKRVAGARDFYTEMIYWTFPKSDADADADVYPNKVLVYNYKNGSWAFNDDCITAFGAFEQQEGMTWETAGDLTWAEADFAWGSGVSQAKFKQVIAGNQQGFVFILMPDVASNAAVMQISLATYVGNILTLTIRDHTIQNGQWIKLFNMNGLTITGTGIYQVTVVDADTVSVVVNTEIPVAITGTYIGGGTASRVSNINILSKQWNFYMKEARGIYLSQIDFIVRKTTNGEITVNYYPSTSSLDLIDEATTTDTLIGTNILETSPHALVGLEETQDRLIHRVYFSGEGNCVQIHFYLSPAQIADPDIAESDFQLEGMVVYTMRTGDI